MSDTLRYLTDIRNRYGIFIEKIPHKFKNNVPLYEIIDNEDVILHGIAGNYNALIELNNYLKIKGLK